MGRGLASEGIKQLQVEGIRQLRRMDALDLTEMQMDVECELCMRILTLVLLNGSVESGWFD